MKSHLLREKVGTLYILGAGASYALSQIKSHKGSIPKSITPLDKDFLHCLNINKPSTGWRRRAIEQIKDGWLEESDIFKEGLEQAIIKRVSQYDFLSNINPARTRSKCNNEDYLNYLTHLITAYLLKSKSNASGDTKHFINHVFPVGEGAGSYKNRIITFNYDTLIERPLIERGISLKKIYFDRIVKDKIDGWSRNADQKFPHPLILKLHGSANWRCSRVDFNKLLTGDPQEEKFTIWENDKAPTPDDDESPLIIPPIPQKPITRSILFKFLWTTAFEYMHEAKEIVIVGYSCPYTDAIARAMFTHFKNKSLQTISVVDPNVLALKNYKEMFNHTQLSNKITWKYFDSFREYIRANLITDKVKEN
jgi:hypothetical protein